MTTPPRLARYLVGTFAEAESREFLLGDLDEGFSVRLRREGAGSARRWYWRQALAAVWHRGRDRNVVRAPGRAMSMSLWWRDFKLAARALRQTPSYTTVTVLTVALAIGANSALFGIVNPVLVKTLPVKDADRLGWVMLDSATDRNLLGLASPAELVEWRARSSSLSDLAAREVHSATLTGHGDATRVTVYGATGNLCRLWGLHASLGRLLEPADENQGAPLVILLSHRYWEQAFQSDPTVIGQRVNLDDSPATIVGVMEVDLEPYGFGRYDVWAPFRPGSPPSRSARPLRVIGWLRPGATFASATEELRALAADAAHRFPDTDAGWTPRVISTRNAMLSPDAWILLPLLGIVVAFVLLIACANLANLMLTRILSRRIDLAVRQGLGASRFELVRPFLLESLLVSGTGGALGLVLAGVILRLINATADEPILRTVSIDQNVLIFTALLSVVTPMIFSLWPVLRMGRGSIADLLRQTRGSAGRDTERRRRALAGCQVALALSLLVVSALLVQTVANFQHVQPGFDLEHELTVQVQPPAARYATDVMRRQFVAATIGALQTVPGVTAVAATSNVPLFDGDNIQPFTTAAHDGTQATDRPSASMFEVSPAFFQAIGIPVVGGRLFTDADVERAAPSVILNRLAAAKYFGTPAGALGQTIRMKPPGAPARVLTIVGVVGDTLSAEDKLASAPQIYVPISQAPPPETFTVILRSQSPADRAADVRAAMRRFDPLTAISMPKTMQQLLHENTADNWVIGALFIGFALLALALAAGGIYGVIAYSVRLRQREIGVRLALGAAPATVGREILFETLRVTGYGVLGGLGIAWLLAEAESPELFGVRATDPTTFGGVTALVLLVATVSVWGPIVNAMRVDPSTALRVD